jgi:hypothetical protein
MSTHHESPARPQRRAWWRVVALTLLLLALGGAAAWAASAIADEPNTPASLARKATLALDEGKSLDAPSAFSAVMGNDFVPGAGKDDRRPGKLAAGDRVIATLTGSLVPVAVESQDGSLVVYSTWRLLAKIKPNEPGQGLATGQPVGVTSVRAYDAVKGKDRLVESGAHSPSLSLDGRLAFVRTDDELLRMNREHTGKVVVGSPDGGGYEVWTSESARYFPVAWVGDTLLVYKAVPDSQATDLYAYTGPDQGRLIASQAFVIALSPDGSRALVTVNRRTVEVVRIADGAIESSMTLDGEGVAPDDPSTPHYLEYSGSWRGDRVVANSDVGLVVLDVEGGIEIESVLATPEFAGGLVQPTFTDDSHVVGWANLAATERSTGPNSEPTYDNALVSCDLAASSCTAGESRPELSWTRWVGNPSR